MQWFQAEVFILQSGSAPAYLKEVSVILVLNKPLAIDGMPHAPHVWGRCVHMLWLVCGWQSRESGAFLQQKFSKRVIKKDKKHLTAPQEHREFYSYCFWLTEQRFIIPQNLCSQSSRCVRMLEKSLVSWFCQKAVQRDYWDSSTMGAHPSESPLAESGGKAFHLLRSWAKRRVPTDGCRMAAGWYRTDLNVSDVACFNLLWQPRCPLSTPNHSKNLWKQMQTSWLHLVQDVKPGEEPACNQAPYLWHTRLIVHFSKRYVPRLGETWESPGLGADRLGSVVQKSSMECRVTQSSALRSQLSTTLLTPCTFLKDQLSKPLTLA